MGRKKNKRKLSPANKRSRKRNISFKDDNAVNLLKKALQNDPLNPIYHSSLATVLQFRGELKEAIACYQKALQIQPDLVGPYNNMGLAFQDLGNSTEAVSCYQKALELKPDHAGAYYNMGDAFRSQDKPTEAVSCYQKAVELKPDYFEAYNNMGIVFSKQGELDRAISYYQKALEQKPDYVQAHNNLGFVLQDIGRSFEAITSYQKALKIKPDYFEAYNNMGTAFADLGKPAEAIPCYQKALKLKPDYFEAYNNMGIALQGQGKLDEAISCCQKTLELKPDYADAYNNMGIALQGQGKLDEAISCCQKALELRPDYADAYNNMGGALQGQGKLNEAISCYQKALELKPDYADACNNLFHQLQHICAWQNLEILATKHESLTKKSLDNGVKTGESPFVSLARHTDLSHNFAVAKSWSCDIARRVSNLKMPFSFDDRKLWKNKIIVGYLSNNFLNHAMAYLMLSMFGLHNRDEFEIFCYSYGRDEGGYYRERIQHDCDKFVDIRNLSHADAAKRIYEDQVDILVDLMGHTRDNRLEICALRPAPIQVRYLGLAGTTGADFFDYIITDRIVTPENHTYFYSEKFVCMPHSYQINDRIQVISNKDWKRADFGLPNDSFIFCSFNQAYKIETVMYDNWMKILQQVPEGVLWLLRENETAEKNLRMEAEARDMKPERLIFSEKLPPDKHLARLRLADVALDTRVVNGAATTSDALRAGVPVITLQGVHFASRMSSSILTAIGLPGLITHSLEEYEALAVRLARNRGELQTIRDRLAKKRLTEPLFDTPRFTRNLEKAYKEMWGIFVTGQRPRQIEVMER